MLGAVEPVVDAVPGVSMQLSRNAKRRHSLSHGEVCAIIYIARVVDPYQPARIKALTSNAGSTPEPSYHPNIAPWETLPISQDVHHPGVVDERDAKRRMRTYDIPFPCGVVPPKQTYEMAALVLSLKLRVLRLGLPASMRKPGGNS